MPRTKTHLKAVGEDVLTFERPGDVEAEAMVISSLLFSSGKVIKQYLPIVSQNYFVKPCFRTAFMALEAMQKDGMLPDLDIQQGLFRKYFLEQPSAAPEHQFTELILLLTGFPRFSNLDSYVAILYEKFRLRELQQMMFEVWGLMNGNHCRADKAVKIIRDKLKTVETGGVLRAGRRLGHDIDEQIARMEALAALEDEFTGIRTGIDPVDNMTLGLQKGDQIIYAGRPSMGKTAAMLCAVWSASRRYPDKLFPVNSLEMTYDQVLQRFTAIITGINLASLRAPRFLTKPEWDKIKAVKKYFKDCNIIIEDKGMGVEEIYGQWLRLAARHDIGFCSLDFVQMLGARHLSDYNGNMRLAVGSVSERLKGFAKDEGVPVVVTSQVNRECENERDRPDGNYRPDNKHLAESDMLVQYADVINMIYRPCQYDEGADKHYAEFGITKQRNGPIGWVAARYDATTTAFSNRAAKQKTLPAIPFGDDGEQAEYEA